MATGQPPHGPIHPARPAPPPAAAALIARRLVEFGDDGSVIFKERGALMEGDGGLLSLYFRAKKIASFRRNITGNGYCNFFGRQMQSVRRVTVEEAAAARLLDRAASITTTPSDGALWLALPGLQRGAGLGMRIVPTPFRGCASRFTAAASEADLATFTRLAKDQTQAPPPECPPPPPPPPPAAAAAAAAAMAPAVLVGMTVRQHPPSVVPVPTPPPRQPLRPSPVLTPPLLPLRAPQRKRERDDDTADDDEAMLMPRYPRPRSLPLAATAVDADTQAGAAAGATAAAVDAEFLRWWNDGDDDDDALVRVEADAAAAAAAAAADAAADAGASADLDADRRYW